MPTNLNKGNFHSIKKKGSFSPDCVIIKLPYYDKFFTKLLATNLHHVNINTRFKISK